MTFEEAFERLIGHEGGYVNHPNDPGGETNWGISKRAYPALDIKNLTLLDARRIYFRDYWGPAGCDAVPDSIKFDLFDMAVNSGVKQSVRTLQRTVGVYDDGILGPDTLQALNSVDAMRVAVRFNGHRLQFMSALANWPSFGRGWANRIAQNLIAL